MSSGVGVRVMTVVWLVCAGCGGVSEQPGGDFVVRTLDESTIEVVNENYAPVRFSVEGCAAFDLALEDLPGTRRPLAHTAQEDGTFVAWVPVAWMRSEADCVEDRFTYATWHTGTLVVTCRDAGRTAQAGFSITSRLDGGVAYSEGDIRAVFAGEDARTPWWISTSTYGGKLSLGGGELRGEWAPVLNPAAYSNPLVWPRLARSGDRAFATLGCETYPQCPLVSIGPGESVPGERLAELAVSDPPHDTPPRAVAHVSTNVIDMAFAGDGSLVVVSDTSVGPGPYVGGGFANPDSARWGETVVWRVVPAAEAVEGVGEDAATVLARFPRETVVSRLSRAANGELVFATVAYPEPALRDVRFNLHVTDGSAVTTSYTLSNETGYCVSWERDCFNWLAAPNFVNAGIYLSPDASSVILVRFLPALGFEEFYWMNTDPSDRAWQPFGTVTNDMPGPQRPRLFDQEQNGGAAWLPGAVALWTGGDLLSRTAWNGLVQVFEAAAPHALRYAYHVDALPGATTPPNLVGVIAVGDHLVLTTRTGVRILDASGSLVGGVDPLPCGKAPTSTAEQIGPTTVAVGVGSDLLTFEVGP